MINASLLICVKNPFIVSSVSLPPTASRSPPFKGGFSLRAASPPGGQPSLDREGACGAGGWDDLCLFAHVTEMLFHRFKHQSFFSFQGGFFYRETLTPIQPRSVSTRSFPHRFAEPPELREAFPTTDSLIYPDYVSSVSLICDSNKKRCILHRFLYFI